MKDLNMIDKTYNEPITSDFFDMIMLEWNDDRGISDVDVQTAEEPADVE